jgi:hypothetical protein
MKQPRYCSPAAAAARVGAIVGAVAAAVAAVLLLSLASCGPSPETAIKTRPNPVLTGGIGFVVVKDAYVRLKALPSRASADLAPLRRGSVYAVLVRDRASAGSEEDGGLWYQLEGEGVRGWAREAELDLYASKEQAERAAGALKANSN